MYVDMWVYWLSLPEQVVPVSVATTKEKPCLSKCGLGVLLPILRSESQTSGCEQSVITTRQLDQMEERKSFLAAEVKEEK